MKSKVQQYRDEFEQRINRAWRTGCRSNCTLAQFKRQLLCIGLFRYERLILPLVTEGKYPASEPAQDRKIIPFPGVSLPELNGFQNRFEEETL
jgi:hypothetical protein